MKPAPYRPTPCLGAAGVLTQPPANTTVSDGTPAARPGSWAYLGARFSSLLPRVLLERGAGLGVGLWAPANKSLQLTAAAATLPGPAVG